MNQFRKARLLVKELGIPNLWAYARYRAQVKSGWLKSRFPANDPRFSGLVRSAGNPRVNGIPLEWTRVCNSDPDPKFIDQPQALLEGIYKPFGGDSAKLDLSIEDIQLEHWTRYENEFDGKDIKLTWEPARFTWVYPLIHAWKMTREEKYPELFWQLAEDFIRSNPVNLGPNWSSAQEMALRTIAWLIALQEFQDSVASTPLRVKSLLEIILLQMDRIPVTLHYARAQHNNHLLSEALALMLAGDALQNFVPQASKWAQSGEIEFIKGILDQVEADGTYSQHSANYHRLMLQLALLFDHRMRKAGKPLPSAFRQRMAAATKWALAQLDPISGKLPNLGHNDGALLLPFAADDFRDYRPTLQAAALAFLGPPALPPGSWDMLPKLLGLNPSGGKLLDKVDSPAVHQVGSYELWATLRAVRFHGRPAHADQLHVEIWWRGWNIARDPGTYMYNGAAPWTNPLDCTCVHNTVTVDRHNQMERVSRFLWLDQAQATIQRQSPTECTASHDGYKKNGVLHKRSLIVHEKGGFLVIDNLDAEPAGKSSHHYTIHWLLPDWKWQIDASTLSVLHDDLKVKVEIFATSLGEKRILTPADVSLIRGGKTLFGDFNNPIHGWESDTYAEKVPALSFLVEFVSNQSIEIRTHWTFSHE